MSIDCPLDPVFSFTYRAEMPGGLTEHEIDHVFVGRASLDPEPDPAEVEAWRWASPDEILAQLAEDPALYTPWFAEALRGLLASANAGPADRDLTNLDD